MEGGAVAIVLAHDARRAAPRRRRDLAPRGVRTALRMQPAAPPVARPARPAARLAAEPVKTQMSFLNTSFLGH